MMVDWKGWRIFNEGKTCIATNGKRRLTTPMPPMPNDQQSFFRASERLKDEIRKSP